MKALITGTPGWLGSKLVEVLVQNGYEVRCLIQPNVNSSFLKQYDIELAIGDVTEKESLNCICKNVDVVIHCAGIIHPKNPGLFYKINTEGTKNLLEESVKNGVSKFIYVSSSSAGISYSSQNAYTEDITPEPYLDYGRSKINAENLLNRSFKEGKIKTVIIRPSWLYGEKGPERQLKFLRMIKLGLPIMFGNGKNFRSLCDINNCVQSLYLAVKSEKSCGKTYYIADEKPYSLMEIYKVTAELLGVTIEPKFYKLPDYNSLTYRLIDRAMQIIRYKYSHIHLAWDWAKNITCNIQKAKEDLDYKPLIDYREGIKNTIFEYRSRGIDL